MAAIYATLIAKGLKTNKSYSVDMYVPDAVSTNVTFNPSGLAASTGTVYWNTPEPIVVIDIVANGAPTAVGAIFTVSGAQYTGQTVRWANQSNALNNRAQLHIPVQAGVQLGLLQF